MKTLIFDIETFPMLALVWGRHDQEIGLPQIEKDWSVAAWGAKWLKDPVSKVHYKDTRFNKDVRNDSNILVPMRDLLDEAEIVITQNGKNFDSKKLNARFMELGIKPPSPYKHIDTYKSIGQVAAFTSHSLEYLTDKLCTKYKKIKHSRFPGLSLWKECLKGNMKAWEEMRRYNVRDVLSTEELYLKTRAWFPATTPDVFEAEGRKCGTCGKNTKEKRGTTRNKAGVYQRYQCQSCHKWSTGGKVK